jgi:hypothetical protein
VAVTSVLPGAIWQRLVQELVPPVLRWRGQCRCPGAR